MQPHTVLPVRVVFVVVYVIILLLLVLLSVCMHLCGWLCKQDMTESRKCGLGKSHSELTFSPDTGSGCCCCWFGGIYYRLHIARMLQEKCWPYCLSGRLGTITLSTYHLCRCASLYRQWMNFMGEKECTGLCHPSSKLNSQSFHLTHMLLVVVTEWQEYVTSGTTAFSWI